MSASAWTWGSYRKGYGEAPLDDPRICFAVLAIKRELAYLGFPGQMLLDVPVFGSATRGRVMRFQSSVGLFQDGMVGPKTANALWRTRIGSYHIPGDWLRAQIHWESGDDPGAEFTNPDGSRDRGLCQLNSAVKPATDDEAFDPMYSIDYLAMFLREGRAKYAGCRTDPDRLAVGRWRTPVGADQWCKHPKTVPTKGGTWAQKAAYYVSRVDVDGRKGWV